MGYVIYQKRADRYYRTSDVYQGRLQRLHELAEQVRNRVIAIGFDGTLAASHTYSTTYMRPGNRPGLIMPVTNWIGRPFARELLDALSQHNRLMVFAAMKRKDFRRALINNVCRPPFEYDHVQNDAGTSDSKWTILATKGRKKVAIPTLDSEDLLKKYESLVARRDLNPRTKNELQHGVAFVPSVFGVGTVLDASPAGHQNVCRDLQLESDASKFQQVRPFNLLADSKGAITAHYWLDNGLLEMLETLATD